jgi:hypothetical protein
LKHFELQLRTGAWQALREDLEVQYCPGPQGRETFILCRSAARLLHQPGLTAPIIKVGSLRACVWRPRSAAEATA